MAPRPAPAAIPSSGLEDPVPVVRPFRALRYDPEHVPSLAAVVAPPYDVVDPAEHAALLARDARNVIRIELPVEEPGDEPDAKYRRAARTLAAWRSDGTFRKDPKAAFYVYEQTYRVPGAGVERTQRGVFGRLRLEAFAAESGVRPHERTMSAPREDRYRLLRATGTNVSPVVALFDDPTGTAGGWLDAVTATAPTAEFVDDADVRQRMWAVDDRISDELPRVAEALGRAPVTIADGHHRYETALRYRDERRMTRSCEEDPAFDYVLALLLDASGPLTILPTHRLVRGLEPDALAGLVGRLPDLFDATKVDSPAVVADALANGAGGEGRFGFVAPGRSAILRARPEAFEALVRSGGAAVRHLDVTLLGAALERLAGIGADAVAAGRLGYTHSADEAIAAVERDGDVAVLLQPTPLRSVVEVAAEGDVMPQKSTFFYPKAVTGLVLNPHEW
jgi:uncharacterized protein (DUF1015 family)